MDYYATLGLAREAGPEEIKKAYRSLAMKHHPDRGGDEKKFKEIEEAYRTLSDPEKKQMYDNPHAGGFNEDILNQFFRTPFGFNFRSAARNPNTQVGVDISLEDAFTGKVIEAAIGLQSGKNKLISIEIPAGVENGMQVRYRGMGETMHPGIPAGDLIVNIRIQPHPTWIREGDNLIYEKNVDVWDAITGSTITFTTIDGKVLNVSMPAGTQPETVLSCKGEGMPNMRTQKRGNLLIKIKISVPKNLNSSDIEKIRKLKNELSTRTT